VDKPSLIDRYWHAFERNAEALWALELPVSQMPVSRLEWHLDLRIWPFEGRSEVLSPRDVLRSPYRFAEEYARTQQASLVFPMEVTWHRGRWVILDGVHRLLKAHEQGHDDVMVRRVPRELARPLRPAS